MICFEKIIPLEIDFWKLKDIWLTLVKVPIRNTFCILGV